MKRELNIIRTATENGAEIDKTNSFEDVVDLCKNFLIEEEIDVIEEEVEVKSIGNYGQRVDYFDMKGFHYWNQGEIVDFNQHWHKPADTKIFHSVTVDTDANVIKMYYLVGETDYNAPEGYIFDQKTQSHIPIPE